MEPSLDTNIQFLTGVGPKRAALYQKLDIFTVRDLLYYFPRSYIDLSSPCEIGHSARLGNLCGQSPRRGKKCTAVCPPRHDHLPRAGGRRHRQHGHHLF